MEWKYYKENICTDRLVASAYINNKKIFDVYENRDSYFTKPYSSYLKFANITYANARKMNTQQEENARSSIDILYASLIHACEYFEEDYERQIMQIINELKILKDQGSD